MTIDQQNGTTDLDVFARELESINSEWASHVQSEREEAKNTRFSIWDGQSPDGRKRKDYLGKDPKPFEGSSDARIRLADLTVNLKKAILMAATAKAVISISGTESGDWAQANKIQTLVRWIIRNQLGWKFRRQMKILMDYMLADSPAVGIMGVFWKDRVELEPASVSLEEAVQTALEQMTQEGMQPTELDAKRVEAVFTNPEQAGEAALLVRVLFPDLDGKQAKGALAAWGRGEAFEFDAAAPGIGLPEMTALKLYEDIWFSGNVREIQNAPVVFVREWLSRPELYQRIGKMGYEEEFVKELVGDAEPAAGAAAGTGPRGFEGQSAFADSLSDWEAAVGEKTGTTWASRGRTNQWEILTAYYLGVDARGRVGRWVMPFSAAMKKKAREAQLIPYAHGMYPFIVFAHETLTARLLDSRGIPELAMSDQQSMKLMNDSFEDHVQVATLPPIKRMRGTVRRQIVMAPMGEVEETRPGEIEWMKGPDYPRASVEHRAEVRRRHAEYFGIPHVDVPGPVTDVLNQDMVDDFLWALADMVKMVIQLCQQNMDPEMMQRVVAGKGIAWGNDRKEIQGQFDITLAFDVATLDPEKFLGKAKILVEVVKALDARAVVAWDKVVESVLQGIDANLAERAIVPVQLASQREADDEQVQISKISAGIEPEMKESGMDFRARLMTLDEAVQRNPELVEKMSETSRKMLEARRKYLQHQVQQEENAQIGRVGAQPVLG
jgi:hypothetical protein